MVATMGEEEVQEWMVKGGIHLRWLIQCV